MKIIEVLVSLYSSWILLKHRCELEICFNVTNRTAVRERVSLLISFRYLLSKTVFPWDFLQTLLLDRIQYDAETCALRRFSVAYQLQWRALDVRQNADWKLMRIFLHEYLQSCKKQAGIVFCNWDAFWIEGDERRCTVNTACSPWNLYYTALNYSWRCFRCDESLCTTVTTPKNLSTTDSVIKEPFHHRP